jgi:hypothetical protein
VHGLRRGHLRGRCGFFGLLSLRGRILLFGRWCRELHPMRCRLGVERDGRCLCPVRARYLRFRRLFSVFSLRGWILFRDCGSCELHLLPGRHSVKRHGRELEHLLRDLFPRHLQYCRPESVFLLQCRALLGRRRRKLHLMRGRHGGGECHGRKLICSVRTLYTRHIFPVWVNGVHSLPNRVLLRERGSRLLCELHLLRCRHSIERGGRDLGSRLHCLPAWNVCLCALSELLSLRGRIVLGRRRRELHPMLCRHGIERGGRYLVFRLRHVPARQVCCSWLDSMLSLRAGM